MRAVGSMLAQRSNCSCIFNSSAEALLGTEAEGMKVRYEEELPTMMVYVVRGDNAMGNLLRHRKPPAPPHQAWDIPGGCLCYIQEIRCLAAIIHEGLHLGGCGCGEET